MKVITVAMEKGGVGKTVTSVNLAAALGQMDLRVLALDLDSQAHTTTWFGIDKQAHAPEHGMYGVLTKRTTLAAALCPTQERGVSIVPAHELVSRAATELASTPDGLFALSDALDALRTTQEAFDVVVVDTPPTKNVLVFSALLAADLIVAPVLAHGMSLEGLTDLGETVERLASRLRNSVPAPTPLVNNYAGQSSADRQIYDYLHAQYADMFTTSIGPDAPLREAFVEQQSIYRYRRTARSAKQFLALAEEVRGKLHG